MSEQINEQININLPRFVKLDDNNIVKQSIVVSNQDTSDASGNES